MPRFKPVAQIDSQASEDKHKRGVLTINGFTFRERAHNCGAIRRTVEIVRVNKIEAASRQLDVAIRLLFNGEDIVAVHTLVGAASRLASDLIAKVDSKKSWDIAAQEVCRIDPQTYRKIMRATRNFLKCRSQYLI